MLFFRKKPTLEEKISKLGWYDAQQYYGKVTHELELIQKRLMELTNTSTFEEAYNCMEEDYYAHLGF
jgi:hypothetical protein